MKCVEETGQLRSSCRDLEIRITEQEERKDEENIERIRGDLDEIRNANNEMETS